MIEKWESQFLKNCCHQLGPGMNWISFGEHSGSEKLGQTEGGSVIVSAEDIAIEY
jgi:hypothetical protein